MLDKKTNRLIEINIWCKHLLIFLLPISLIAIASPFYALYEIEKRLNFEINIFVILDDIYKNNSGIQRMTLMIIPTILCIYLVKWSSKKLNN